MNSFYLRILASDEPFYQGECQSLSLPIQGGQYGVLAHHCNTIAAVVPGILTYQPPGEQPRKAVISTGLMKVENNQVLVLADTIERPEELDENRAFRAAQAAREALLKKSSRVEYRMAQSNLAREVNRVQAKKNLEKYL